VRRRQRHDAHHHRVAPGGAGRDPAGRKPIAVQAPAAAADVFEPATSTITFASRRADYLDPLFLPELVAHLKKVAPLTAARASAAVGRVRLSAQFWPPASRPGHRQLARAPRRAALGKLMKRRDRLPMTEDHPIVRVARGPAAGRREVPGLRACGAHADIPRRARRDRRASRKPRPVARHHGAQRPLQPDPAHGRAKPAGADDGAPVLFTLCRQPAGCASCAPGSVSRSHYYQLWHDLTHASSSWRWLREQVRDVARGLASHGMLKRSKARAA